MAITDNAALRTKKFITPQEQAGVASQSRQDSLQNNNNEEPIHIGEYNPSTLEGQQAYNSVVSEVGIGGFMRRSKQEWQTRRNEHSAGQMGLNDGLSSGFNAKDSANLKNQQKWGSNFGDMKSMMGSLKKGAKDAKSQGQSLTGDAGEKVANLASMPISMATSELLQKSWLNLIDSFGLTLLYINFHVFCRWVFGEKLFCKLGHEWLSGKGGTGNLGKAAKAEGTAAKGASKGMGEEGGAMKSLFGLPEKGIGIAEVALLGILDLIVLFALVQALMPFIILALIMQDPVAAAQLLIDVATELISLVTSMF